MTRPSDKTDNELLRLIEGAGFSRLAGIHTSNNSIHTVQCKNCGMIFDRKSRAFVEGKIGCKFTPCTKKGKLSLMHVQRVAKKHGVEEVWHPLVKTVELHRLEIKVSDELRFKKGSKEMNQTWREVRSRALSSKNGRFFIADSKRRKPAKPIQLKQIKDLCKPLDLAPLSSVSARAKVESYIHQKCSQAIPLTYYQLEKWREIDCPHCYPIKKAKLQEFQNKVNERGFEYSGDLYLEDNSNRVDRGIKYVITCSSCGNQNDARTYDWIFYRGYLYCDNKHCKKTYDNRDIAHQSPDYYVNLFKSKGCKSFVESQMIFPRSASFVKRARIKGKPNSEAGEMFHYVRQKLKWNKNLESKYFTKKEVKEEVVKAIDAGATSIQSLINLCDPRLYNYFIRNRDKWATVFLKILDNVGFSYKKNHEISSMEQAINFIEQNLCKSWSEVTSRFPTVASRVIGLELKDEIFDFFNWEHLRNYSNKTDNELLAIAMDIISEHNFNNIDSIGSVSYGLLSNLRQRNLVEELCDQAGISLLNDWSEYSYLQTLELLRLNKVISLTYFHASYVSLYKLASKREWLDDLVRDMKWQNYEGLDGYSYDSVPELIVANILKLLTIDYIRQPKIHAFRGMNSGRMRGDFLLDKKVWVEVWAYGRGDAENYLLDGYTENRLYKEENYQMNAMPLIDIEGGVYYRKTSIRGEEVSKGFDSFVKHVLIELSEHGYKLASYRDIIPELKQSLTFD